MPCNYVLKKLDKSAGTMPEIIKNLVDSDEVTVTDMGFCISVNGEPVDYKLADLFRIFIENGFQLESLYEILEKDSIPTEYNPGKKEAVEDRQNYGDYTVRRVFFV